MQLKFIRIWKMKGSKWKPSEVGWERMNDMEVSLVRGVVQ